MSAARPVQVELSAVILALDTGADGAARAARPVVLAPAMAAQGGRDLPTAAFDPDRHRTLQSALRAWVAERTGLELGYVEQLYTFGDPVRSGQASAAASEGAAADTPAGAKAGAKAGAGATAAHTVSIGYLALVGPEAVTGPEWSGWDVWFPWEDLRAGVPPVLAACILPALAAWAGRGPDRAARRERLDLLFGRPGLPDGPPWRDELVLERYELLYEADLVVEAWRDRGEAPPGDLPRLGRPAPRDHRRIMATGLGRLRGKLKYRPVMFELVGPRFTLFELQRAAEAVSGMALHKQNFRRMVERSGLIEPTGGQSSRHGGRPAAEYRLAPEATWERRAAAVRFGGARQGGR